MSRKKNQSTDLYLHEKASSAQSKEKDSKTTTFPFGISYGKVPTSQIKRHLLYLIAIAIIVKIVVILVSISYFTVILGPSNGTTEIVFYDSYDFLYYLQSASNVFLQGQIPYVNFSFDYPPLVFVPIFLAFIPAYIFNSQDVFICSFQFLMVICDIITVICIYLVGLKLYPEKTAFIAGVLYASAFSVAYFVLSKYDAFPTCILMLAVLFTVYRREIVGYGAVIAGFLAKIFPVIALPFLLIYNAKSTSLRLEIVSLLKIGLPVAVVCLIPVILLKPGILYTYLSGSLVRSAVYVNTATYTIYAYLHDILHLGISLGTISTCMDILMGLILLFLIAIAYIEPKKDTRFLVKLLAIAIFVVVFCMNYHSPQYIVWFTPFVCLLVADSLYGIVLFYVTQAITYIEFPLAFTVLYVNGNYIGETGTSLWYLALLFFTTNFAAYLLLMYIAVKPTGSHARMLLAKIRKLVSKKA
jgi:hypothetical protein